jgi:hypothetical protein
MIKNRLTYSNVMATIATFIALSGASYAAVKLPVNSVGARQLKTGAVTGAKVKDGSLGGADIDAASLGTVPNAAHAQTATTAQSATTAQTATSALRAGTAANAETIGGKGASQIIEAAKPSCPTGTKMESGLCFDVTERNANLLVSAIAICAREGRWLPDLPQIISFQEHNYAGAQPEEWSDEIYLAEGYEWGYTAHTDAVGASIGRHKASETKAYRCVTGPTA